MAGSDKEELKKENLFLQLSYDSQIFVKEKTQKKNYNIIISNWFISSQENFFIIFFAMVKN